MNLLKKLRWLDYIIVILIVSVLTYLLFFIRPEQSTIEITVISRDVPLYLTNSFKGGDFEKDPSGRIIAEITDKTLYPSRNNNTTTRDMFLTVKLVTTINNKTREIEYKNKSFNIGSPVEFKFNSGIVQAVVIKMNAKNKKNVYKTVTVTAYQQHSWIKDKLTVGQGDAEVLQLLSKESVPSKIELRPDQATPLYSDQTVDLILKLKILGEQTNNQFLFANEKPILIGDVLSFYVGNVYIQDAVITSIDD